MGRLGRGGADYRSVLMEVVRLTYVKDYDELVRFIGSKNHAIVTRSIKNFTLAQENNCRHVSRL